MNGGLGQTIRGGALSPIRLLWGYIPTGRESGLKIHPVWVRIPLPLPFILRASVAVARRSLKSLWLGSNPRPSAKSDAYSNLFKDHSVKMTHLKTASSLCLDSPVGRAVG